MTIKIKNQKNENDVIVIPPSVLFYLQGKEGITIFMNSMEKRIRVYPRDPKEIEKYPENPEILKFLEETGITVNPLFIGQLTETEEKKVNGRTIKKVTFRDQYKITFSRPGKPGFSVTFTNSLNDSRGGIFYNIKENPLTHTDLKETFFDDNGRQRAFPWYALDSIRPSLNSIFSCLTLRDPGESFENFAMEYGYDADSRKAESIYLAVFNEWHQVKRFFSESELDRLNQIEF